MERKKKGYVVQQGGDVVQRSGRYFREASEVVIRATRRERHDCSRGDDSPLDFLRTSGLLD